MEGMETHRVLALVRPCFYCACNAPAYLFSSLMLHADDFSFASS